MPLLHTLAGRPDDQRPSHRRSRSEVQKSCRLAPRSICTRAASGACSPPPSAAASVRAGDRPSHLAGGDLPACLLKPVADQVAFRRHAAGLDRERPRHVVLTHVRDQQLAAEQWLPRAWGSRSVVADAAAEPKSPSPHDDPRAADARRSGLRVNRLLPAASEVCRWWAGGSWFPATLASCGRGPASASPR